MSKNPRKDPEWYFEHRKELDAQAAKRIAAGASVLTQEKIKERIKAVRKKSRPVTIRLDVDDIELAKQYAGKLGLPYQTYLKSLLHQALRTAVRG